MFIAAYIAMCSCIRVSVDCFGKRTRVCASLEEGEILKCKVKVRRFTYPGRQAGKQAAVRPVIDGR